MKNVLRNVWYLAAWSTEVTDKPFGRRILDTPTVLFRGLDGSIAALRDRCPHRFAPLSRGRLINGELECGYHGLRFDQTGQCVKAPILGEGISNVSVDAFPVEEVDGFIWIWPGDAAKADRAQIPDMSFLRPNKNIEQLRMYMRQESNFFLGVDNLMDPSHTAFLHRASLSQGTDFFYELFRSARYDCRNHPNGKIGSAWSFPNEEGSFSEDEVFEAIWWPPSIVQQRSRSRIIGEIPEEGIDQQFIHIMTPETEHTTHYFAIDTYDVRLKDQAYLTEREILLKEKTFLAEDDPMLSDIDRTMDGADLFSLDPVILPADAAAIQVRRSYARLLKAELERAQSA